jgi:hypothetical protein
MYLKEYINDKRSHERQIQYSRINKEFTRYNTNKYTNVNIIYFTHNLS